MPRYDKWGRPIDEKDAVNALLAGIPEKAYLPRSRPRGLFGGGRNPEPSSVAEKTAMAPQQAPQPGRRLGFWDRIGDAASVYKGDGTPNRDRLDALNFDDQFNKMSVAGEMDPASRQRQLQQMMSRRAAMGGDVTRYDTMIESNRNRAELDALVGSLPQPLQAAGRVSPESAAAYQFDQNTPEIYSQGPTLVRGSKGGNDWGVVHSDGYSDFIPDPDNPGGLRPRPGGPMDPSYRAEVEGQTTAAQYAARPPEPIAPPGQSEVMGSILAKVAQYGVDSLLPGERAIWERYNREPQNPYDMLGGLLGGGALGPAPGGGAPAPNDPFPGIAEGEIVRQGGKAYRRQGNQMVPVN